MKDRKYFLFSNLKRKLLEYKFILIGVSLLIFIIVGGVLLIPMAFASPVSEVQISSDNLNFEDNEPGAWKVDKSAKWIGKGEAEITFDVDSVMKTNNKNTDVLFVLDISGSMDGEKLDRVKADSIELIESLLSDDKNKAGLITFDSTSNIVLDFTKNEELLKEKINSLTATGCTNYYQALVNVDEVLKKYKKEKDRECIVLFLTDGYPNEDTPNEETQYNYLRQQYPFITINGIQYEMGTNVLEPVKKVSDNQFIADIDTLNNVLFDASVTLITYDEFSITDYIDTSYFYVQDENEIKVSQGNVEFDRTNQKVTWNIDNLRSGSNAKMAINVKLKEELIGKGGFYPTNIKEKIKSKLGEVEENIDSDKTPVLSDNYKVIYDDNAPAGCNVKGVPETRNHSVFDTVGISESIPTCEGYQFKGWVLVTNSARWINDDYFTMPEEDVIIRAEWSKLELDKNMNGEVYVHSPTLEKVKFSTEYFFGGGESGYNVKLDSELHKYEESLTKVVIENKIEPKDNAVDVLDISEDKVGEILAYIVPNNDDNSKYTAYIQCDGKIKANEDSSYLFGGFSYLKSIEGLENIDTSKVTNMRGMFGSSGLETLDLTSLNTSNVTDMSFMFADIWALDSNSGIEFEAYISNLKEIKVNNLNISKVVTMKGMFVGTAMSNDSLNQFFGKLDTSNVTDMSYMFYRCAWDLNNLILNGLDISHVKNIKSMFAECGNLKSIVLSNFDTSNITNMSSMFSNCSSLTSLDLSNFDTSNITNMGSMFSNCSSLTSLDLSNLNTSNVTDMSHMFDGCSGLTSLNLSNFNTSNATNMSSMFMDCGDLTSLDLSNFNTLNVTDVSSMFEFCNSLTSLDLSNFDTSKVTNMSDLFRWCCSLTSLDLSNFDTSKVTNMSSMFESCRSLTSIDLSSFDTSNVIYIIKMFYDCSSLTSLDLSGFNTSSVTEIRYMFSYCSSLTSLDLSSFDTSNAIDMCYMFYSCGNLINLDLSSFDTSSVTDIESMFGDCSNLTTTISIKGIEENLDYRAMFLNSATAPDAKITVNYTDSTSEIVDNLISTKSANSNVVKGEKIPEYTITITGNDDIVTDSKAYAGKKVILSSKSGNFRVKSFNMNGALIEGNKFKMPEGATSITDITVVDAVTFESEHNPYPDNLDSKVYAEKRFTGATSLTVDLDYQTGNVYYDWINLYDSTGKVYGKYGGSTRKMETIAIPGDYIKIVFTTDSYGNDYYGFRATVVPNYD